MQHFAQKLSAVMYRVRKTHDQYCMGLCGAQRLRLFQQHAKHTSCTATFTINTFCPDNSRTSHCFPTTMTDSIANCIKLGYVQRSRRHGQHTTADKLLLLC